MSHNPIGVGFTVTSNGSSVVSDPFPHRTDTIRVVAVGKNGHVSIGTNPTATHVDYMITTSRPETINLGIVKAGRVVGITTGSTTTIDFPEGTGSPFSVGNAVSLTVSDQPYYNFTHKTVLSVSNSSGYNGNYSTRIVVDNDSSGIATAFNSSYAELRNSLRIAFISEGGNGYVHCQQVQITNQA